MGISNPQEVLLTTLSYTCLKLHLELSSDSWWRESHEHTHWALWELCEQDTLEILHDTSKLYKNTPQKCRRLINHSDAAEILDQFDQAIVFIRRQQTLQAPILLNCCFVLYSVPPCFFSPTWSEKTRDPVVNFTESFSVKFHVSLWRTMGDTTWASVLAQLRCQQHVTWPTWTILELYESKMGPLDNPPKNTSYRWFPCAILGRMLHLDDFISYGLFWLYSKHKGFQILTWKWWKHLKTQQFCFFMSGKAAVQRRTPKCLHQRSWQLGLDLAGGTRQDLIQVNLVV